MNILLVNNVCAAGGVEAQLRLLARGLIAKGHQVSIYFYHDAGALDWFNGLCKTICGPNPTPGEVICRGNFDLIHTNIATADIGFLNTLKLIGYHGPVVATSHGNLASQWDVTRPSTTITAVSNYVADELQNRLGIKPTTIYNAVDSEVFTAEGPIEESDSPVLLWVGRAHDPDKDFPGLAVAASVAYLRGWNTWIVDGCRESSFNRLEEWLPKRCKIFRNVDASGMATVYRSVAKSGGCLISTSQREAFGMAVLEAMMCDCPVVAPKVGGLQEVVEDRVTGLLYNRGDGIEAINGILNSIENSEVRNNLVEQARKRATDTFSVESMVSQYEDLYLHLAKTSSQRHSTARKLLSLAAFSGRRLVRSCIGKGG